MSDSVYLRFFSPWYCEHQPIGKRFVIERSTGESMDLGEIVRVQNTTREKTVGGIKISKGGVNYLTRLSLEEFETVEASGILKSYLLGKGIKSRRVSESLRGAETVA